MYDHDYDAATAVYLALRVGQHGLSLHGYHSVRNMAGGE